MVTIEEVTIAGAPPSQTFPCVNFRFEDRQVGAFVSPSIEGGLHVDVFADSAMMLNDEEHTTLSEWCAARWPSLVFVRPPSIRVRARTT